MLPRRLVPLVGLLLLAAACAKKKPSTTPHAQPAPPPVAAGSSEEGMASWYGGKDGFEGKPTASGEIFDGARLTAAHRTLPLGTWIDVLNLSNGREVRVRINDRGPFAKGRILDLSRAAAEKVSVIGPGTARVRITVTSPGPSVIELSPTGRWSVQIGSFSSAYRAETFARKARDAGHRAYTEPYDGLTRVKVGPFKGKPEAAAELERLEAGGFEGIVVPAETP